MTHRILKTALINDEIDMTLHALRYILKYSSLMEADRKSKYGRLLVKLEKQAEKLPRKIEVITPDEDDEHGNAAIYTEVL